MSRAVTVNPKCLSLRCFLCPRHQKTQTEGLQIDSHTRTSLDHVIARQTIITRKYNRLKSLVERMLAGKLEVYSGFKQVGRCSIRRVGSVSANETSKKRRSFQV